jgi:hypothetical protein
MTLRMSDKEPSKRQKGKKVGRDLPSCSALSERFRQVKLLRKLVNAAEHGNDSAPDKMVLKGSRCAIDIYH